MLSSRPDHFVGSTILKIITGEVNPPEGEVAFDDIAVLFCAPNICCNFFMVMAVYLCCPSGSPQSSLARRRVQPAFRGPSSHGGGPGHLLAPPLQRPRLPVMPQHPRQVRAGGTRAHHPNQGLVGWSKGACVVLDVWVTVMWCIGLCTHLFPTGPCGLRGAQLDGPPPSLS